MFGFFNKWKRAGKGVGISGGVGKLAMFDKDGNVVSSGISVEGLDVKIYRHAIRWSASDDSDTTFDVFLTLYTKSATALTATTFYTALPAHDANPLAGTGWATSPLFETQFPAYAVGKAAQEDRITIYALAIGVITEFAIPKTFGTFTDTVQEV